MVEDQSVQGIIFLGFQRNTQNIGQLFYTFVAGLAMALMYEFTGSIWCSVFFHLFNNEMSVITEVLYYGRYGEACVPYLSLLDAVLFLLGMVSLVVLIVYYKRRNTARNESSAGIYGASSEMIGSRESALDVRAVTKGLLAPGMVAFTAVAAVLMVVVWIALIAVNGGGAG